MTFPKWLTLIGAILPLKRKDPLEHVPRYDKTKEPPDDVLEEKGFLNAVKEANAVLSKKQDR